MEELTKPEIVAAILELIGRCSVNLLYAVFAWYYLRLKVDKHENMKLNPMAYFAVIVNLVACGFNIFNWLVKYKFI